MAPTATNIDETVDIKTSGASYQDGSCNVTKAVKRKRPQDLLAAIEKWAELRNQELQMRKDLQPVVAAQRDVAKVIMSQIALYGKEMLSSNDGKIVAFMSGRAMTVPTSAERRGNLEELEWMDDDKMKDVLSTLKKTARWQYVLSVSKEGQTVVGASASEFSGNE